MSPNVRALVHLSYIAGIATVATFQYFKVKREEEIKRQEIERKSKKQFETLEIVHDKIMRNIEQGRYDTPRGLERMMIDTQFETIINTEE